MTEEQRDLAITRIKAKRSFWWHLGLYLIVIAALIGVWGVTSRGYFWPGWVMFGWGIGVAVHGLGVFAGSRPISEERIQREIERGL